MKYPLISVLVPLYNHARYIETCLASIRDDQWPYKEVIIVDDGSTDGSADIAREWYKKQDNVLFKRFEVVSRPNKGITPTLNELVAMAQGDYLVPIASDDILLSGGIGARVAYLQEHPDKLAVFGDCIVMDEHGSKTHDSGIRGLYRGNIEMLANPEMLDLELIYNWCVPGPGFMARRDLYETLGGYDESLMVEDWDMYLRIAAQGKLGFIADSVAAYRCHGNSTNASPARCNEMNKCHLKTIEKYGSQFSGLRRIGLFYHYFRLKFIIAKYEKRKCLSYLYKMIYKPLGVFSFKRYKKLVRVHSK